MADDDLDLTTLSPQTHACHQGLTRAKHELKTWAENLMRALADDVRAKRLTAKQASALADQHDLDFTPPKDDEPDAVETTAEANEAQRVAQAKKDEAVAKADQDTAAKAAPPAPADNGGDKKPATTAAKK